jgi:hypothetical protein
MKNKNIKNLKVCENAEIIQNLSVLGNTSLFSLNANGISSSSIRTGNEYISGNLNVGGLTTLCETSIPNNGNIKIGTAGSKVDFLYAGNSVITSGTNNVSITNSNVNLSSLIFITPTTINNKILCVTNLTNGSFNVAIGDNSTYTNNITFNYIIINKI